MIGKEGGVGRLQQAAGDLQLRLRELCRQCGVGWPGVTDLGRPANIIDSHSTSVE